MNKRKKDSGKPCDRCGNPQAKKIMTIIEGPCHSCGHTMKIAYVSSSNSEMLRGHMRVPPSKFNNEEIEFAKSKEVILHVNFSNPMQENYLANTCGHCGNFSGDFYLFREYVSPASMGELPSQAHEIGLICETCEQ